MREKVIFQAGKETIVGTVLGNNTIQPPDFIFLHGAGKSNKERVRGFLDEPSFKIIPSIITFDFSGHGESTGTLKESSLQQRVLEATTAINLHTTKKRLTVCGSSMGGYIAFKMLETHDVKNLILFAPAVYDRRVFGLSFDNGFTEAIRRPESWRDSDVFHLLEKFTGNLLLFIGGQDEVIPREVIDLIDLHSPKTVRKDVVTFNGCSHDIQDWLIKHPTEKKVVMQKIAEYYLS